LTEWVNASGKYAHDWGSGRWVSPETVADVGLEEQLNFKNLVENPDSKDLQLDLLLPIKLI
jgi:hypothetical protein